MGSNGLEDTPERGGHGRKEEVGHVPVLLKEAIDFLAVRRGGTYIDATVGLGGHSLEIARRLGAPGHLIGLDKDPAALEIAQKKLTGEDARRSIDSGESWPEITLLHSSFTEIAERCQKQSADGILADLGVSSLQLENAARGFSFQAEGPLDMRMNPLSELTAEQVVNHFDERKLADVIYEF
ncbi:MAG TPA: 16S rRNA (cytosine(1402)-N(4))-methyltransferase, partial [Terriglobales bacterium]|nr:16S rRNA (cytosine(1402)-N(4))-methyltransferase [Terriglobales bacterium]